MKKLMTVLAGVATALFAFGAVGDVTVPPNGFESYTSGSVFDPEVQENESTYWYAASKDDGNIISNYVESGTAVPTLATGVTRPDTFVDQTNTKFLSLDTTTPLFRSVQANNQDGTFTGSTIGDNGIYLDTLVKFTAADAGFAAGALEQNVDKIAIEYVEHGVDSLTDDEPDTYTNFVIRAGYIATEVIQTNYYAYLPSDPTFENFKKDDWHRLTVRAIPNIGGNKVGFVVYVDQKPLAYSTDVACGDNFTATGPAAEFYTDELHAVYPSAVGVGDDKNKIAAASFSGTGFIDDVVFTTTKPDFIVLDPDVTVEWDANVATLTLNGEAVEGFDAGTAGSAKVTPVGGVVTVAATFANGYVYGACDTSGNGAWNASTQQFTGLTPGETCSIYGMLPTFKVGADQYFDNFEDALAAAVEAGTAQDPATLQLMANCDSLLNFTEGNIVLDLAGYDVQGGLDADYSIINAGANLTIINTGTEASIKMPLSGATTAMYQDANGFTTVEAGTFEGVIQFNVDYDETFPQTYMLLKGGSFIDPEYETESKFYLEDCVQAGLTPAYDSVTGYVSLGGEEPPQPTTYDVTYTPPANATVVTDPVTVTGLEAGDTVEFTVTPATGYEYAEAPTGWTLDNGAIKMTYTVVAGENAVTIPSPTASTYTVTVTPDQNATYAAAYKVGGETITPVNDVLTVTVGQTIVITATPAANYEYAETPTGWTAGQDGEITIEVSEAAEIAIPAPTAKSSGYDSGDGQHTFTIAADREAALENALPAGKTLASAVSETSSMTYAQAYALGLWSENSATVGELDATISVAADGKVTVSLANAPATGYSVTCKVYEKASLTAEWPSTPTTTYAYGSEQALTPGSATAGFYKVEVVISNSLQQ